jgi:hypothetical protein
LVLDLNDAPTEALSATWDSEPFFDLVSAGDPQPQAGADELQTLMKTMYEARNAEVHGDDQPYAPLYLLSGATTDCCRRCSFHAPSHLPGLARVRSRSCPEAADFVEW